MSTGRIALVHDFLLDLRGAERVFAGDLRRLAGGGRVHRRLRPERAPRGASRRARRARSFLQRRQADRAQLPPAAAAVSARRRVARPARLRHRHLVLERVGARRARRSRRRARLLLPQPVPLRLVRARGDARRPQPAHPPAAAPAARRAGASGTGSPPSASTATWPTPRSRPRACGATSAASRPSCTRRWSSRRFAPGPVGDHYLVLAELMAHKRIDVAVRAFNALRRPLLVVGDGPECAPAAAARRADRAARPAGSRDGDVARAAAHRPRARGHRGGGVRHRGRRGARLRAAGDRAALRRRARDRRRRAHRRVLRRRRRPGVAGRRRRRLRPGRGRPGGVRGGGRSASAPSASRQRLRAIVAAASAALRPSRSGRGRPAAAQGVATRRRVS